MNRLPGLDAAPVVHRAMRRKATVAGIFAAAGRGFETHAVPELNLTVDGIPGDCHFGSTRKAGAREPWYPRGTDIRNERALSLVAVPELTMIAHGMEVAMIKPEWLGANILMDGVPHFSFLPAGTRLFFEGGAALIVTAQNKPCRHAGAAVARHTGGPAGTDLLFPQRAANLRGLVATVERPGAVRPGMAVDLRIPEQWIYAG